MTTADDARWLDVQHELKNLRVAIYGDKAAPPNGGGVYGEIKRVAAAGNQRMQRLERLEHVAGSLDDSVTEMEQVLTHIVESKPRWWDGMIVVGIVTLLAMQLAMLWLIGTGGG